MVLTVKKTQVGRRAGDGPMIRAPATTHTIRGRALLTLGWVALSAVLLAHPGVRYLLLLPHDWVALTTLTARVGTTELYLRGGEPTWFVWSPIAALLLAHVFIPLGYAFWLGLHLASLVIIRNWRVAVLALLSVPFWADTIGGNTFVFVFAAGVAALSGSRWGAIGYLALCCLVPRPVQLPLALWLLWKRPDVRLPFAAMVSVTLAVALATGYLGDWLGVLIAIGRTNDVHFANLSPTKLIGVAWLAIGIPLSAWLTLKGYVGLAGLAISPYILPAYPLVLLWEWVGRPERSSLANVTVVRMVATDPT